LGCWDPQPSDGEGLANFLETSPLLHKCYHRNFSYSKSNGWSDVYCVIRAILQKSLNLRVPPFKVTHGHWNRHGSIGYLWLPVSVP